MTTRDCLGWWVLRDEWDEFVDHVERKWGETDSYLQFELESAMREFLDKDADLVEAEQLLRRYMDARELSSSSASVGGISFDGDTRKVMQRVQAELKAEFKKEGKKRYDDNLGAILSRALRSYRLGGRAKRVKNLVHQFVTDGIASDTTASSDESISESRDKRDTTAPSDESNTGSDERTRDTTTEADESGDQYAERKIDAMLVSDIASQLGDAFTEENLHKQIAMHAGGSNETLELYSEAVVSYENVVEHPGREGLYISPEQRDKITVYDDLDREVRVKKLREMLVATALSNRDNKRGITYTEVQDLFREHFCGAPSHDYVYKLMSDENGIAAIDADGFGFNDSTTPYRLEVTLTDVAEQYISAADDYCNVDESLVDDLDVFV